MAGTAERDKARVTQLCPQGQWCVWPEKWAWCEGYRRVLFLSPSMGEMAVTMPVILSLTAHCYHLGSFKHAAAWSQRFR